MLVRDGEEWRGYSDLLEDGESIVKALTIAVKGKLESDV